MRNITDDVDKLVMPILKVYKNTLIKIFTDMANKSDDEAKKWGKENFNPIKLTSYLTSNKAFLFSVAVVEKTFAEIEGQIDAYLEEDGQNEI